MDEWKKFIIIFTILSIITLTFIILTSITSEEKTTITKCYDQYNNEIIGAECVSHGYEVNNLYLILSCLFSISMILYLVYMTVGFY